MQRFVNIDDLSRLNNCVVKVGDDYVFLTGRASPESEVIMQGFKLSTMKPVLVDYTADDVVPGPFTLGYCEHRMGQARFMTKVTGRQYGYGLNTSNVRSMHDDGYLGEINRDVLRSTAFKNMLDNKPLASVSDARAFLNDHIKRAKDALLTVIATTALNRDFAIRGSTYEDVFTLMHQNWAVGIILPSNDDVLWNAAGDTSIIMKKFDRAMSRVVNKKGRNT